MHLTASTPALLDPKLMHVSSARYPRHLYRLCVSFVFDDRQIIDSMIRGLAMARWEIYRFSFRRAGDHEMVLFSAML
jgi:hypothetical protein